MFLCSAPGSSSGLYTDSDTSVFFIETDLHPKSMKILAMKCKESHTLTLAFRCIWGLLRCRILLKTPFAELILWDHGVWQTGRELLLFYKHYGHAIAESAWCVWTITLTHQMQVQHDFPLFQRCLSQSTQVESYRHRFLHLRFLLWVTIKLHNSASQNFKFLSDQSFLSGQTAAANNSRCFASSFKEQTWIVTIQNASEGSAVYKQYLFCAFILK